ncbi:MAG: D-cysteine desulfhydrase family protein [Anaeromicrobium sp.]|uniref:D-cysteine desulfhydrase family protein n=1 Tax=Anaeromicrobium sp. TaxID=1929132 RepID=UPI0025CEFC0B|nr:D-cysteine desulfhydrase family protein [Anaeromicrobium sp.]MCT4595672.1 D-cysteine desulfhydrase family protein [Anaeromicrobium sp.]
MMKLPAKIEIANLPTKIEKLDRLSKSLEGHEIYIKRDDQTGTEIAGNKVRKLEYSVKEALNQGCDYLITCGGVQSNHARATAAVAAKLGIKSFLVLRNKGEKKVEGNCFLDQVLGAQLRFITADEYSNHRMDIMKEIKAELDRKGHKAYIIPEGASNGIGTFGYYNAMEEILKQEEEMGIKFDAIVMAVGSGGTYAGLFYGNKINENSAKIFGVNVCDDAQHFKEAIENILHESFQYTDQPIEFTKEEINIIDGYVGKGYALSRPEELKFIHELAKLEGVILDPVYTGKAMYGLVEEIKKGNLKDYKNILFIHTGGLFGLFPKQDQFSF